MEYLILNFFFRSYKSTSNCTVFLRNCELYLLILRFLSLVILFTGEVIVIPTAGELKTKLNAATKSSRLSVIYFTATWCGPCRQIAPVFSSLAGKYRKAVFLKVDIDKARDAATEYNVSSVPTFFFLKNGREIDKVVGADKNGLERKVAEHAG